MKTKFDLWLENVNKERKEYWDERFSYKPYEPLRVDKGRKYIRLWDGTSAWGFIAKTNGVLKGIPYFVGDVFKAATWRAPAKHVRGTIFSSETNWFSWTGPRYL